MKTNFRHRTHVGFIGLLAIFLFIGCSGFGQKLDKWQASFTESVKETFNFGDDNAKSKKSDVKTSKPSPKNYPAGYCKDCYRHTVRWHGESMSLIARWYTGSSNNWRKLAKANPRINPNRIQKGHVILIPSRMLKTKEPLPQKLAARYTQNYFAHTVKRDGEKMTVIANWYTGNAANWKVIAKANPKLDPDHLVAGNEIYIPSKILKTRKPFPGSQSVPAVETPRKKPATVDHKTTTDEEEDIKIFGPKQFPRS